MTAAMTAGRREGFALGLALSAFDAAATWLWLTLGLATEANPIVANLIDGQGLTAAMGLRALLGVLWFGGFYVLARHSKLAKPAQFASIGLLALLALYHLSFGALNLSALA